MLMQHVNTRVLSLALLTSVAFLPGCKEWFGGDKSSNGQTTGNGTTPVAVADRSVDEADIFMTINGRPAVTRNDFDEYIEQIAQANPQVRTMLQVMPDMKMNIFSGLASQEIIAEWALQNGIESNKDYQRDLAQSVKSIERGLAVKYFQNAHPVSVSDADVQKFYDDNKDSIYLMSAAGIVSSGVQFDSEDAAKDFLAKASGAEDFAKIARDEKLSVRNFGRVNENSVNVEDGLRDKILALNKFPQTTLIKVDDGKAWVVNAKAKEEAKHFSFEQAADDARNRLTQERTQETLMAEIDKLRVAYHVVEYKDRLAEPEEEQQVAEAEQAPVDENQESIKTQVA